MAHRMRAVFFALAAACVLALGLAPNAALAAEGDLELMAPEHAKTISRNADGTYKITLSVTGNTAEYSRTQPVNVVVLQDLSNSMDEVGSSSYTEFNGTPNWNGGTSYYGLVNGSYVRLQQRWLGDGSIGYYTGFQWNTYSGQLYVRRDASRLDIAKQALSGLGEHLLNDSNRADVNMYLVPFGTNAYDTGAVYTKDNAAAFTTAVNGLTVPYSGDTGGTNWSYALWQANQIAKKTPNTPTYVVFLSDGLPTYRGGWPGTPAAGSGTHDNNGEYLKEALNQMNAANRAANIKAVFPIYTANDAKASMDSFAASIDLPSDHAFNGTDIDELKGVLDTIAETITDSARYTNVSICDGLSENVEFVGMNTVSCAYTDPDGKETSWGTEATASVAYDASTKRVTWQLPPRLPGDDHTNDVPGLLSGWTYSVSFNVRLSDPALQKAAEEGTVQVATNTEGSDDTGSYVEYDVVATIGNQTTTTAENQRAEYPSPLVPVSSLVVGKTVTGNISDPGQHYDFTVTLPAGRYYLNYGGVADGDDEHASGPANLNAGTYTFKLCDGETLAIGGFEAADQATVVEKRADVAGHTTTAALNGASLRLGSSTDNGTMTLTSDPATFPTGENNASGLPTTSEQKVQFTNDATAVAPTGVEPKDPVPYAALFGAATVAAVAYGIKVKVHGREE